MSVSSHTCRFNPAYHSRFYASDSVSVTLPDAKVNILTSCRSCIDNGPTGRDHCCMFIEVYPKIVVNKVVPTDVDVEDIKIEERFCVG